MKQFPLVTGELVEALERAFPDRLPRQLSPIEEYGRLIGQQQVLDFLRQKHVAQLKPKRQP